MGKLYLIHFGRPYHHARHYLGFTSFGSAEQRFRAHSAGKGAVLTKHVVAAGIKLYLAWVRDGDRREERRLKRRAHVWQQCPLCLRERRKK